MHWSTPKTKDRMLQDTSGDAAGSSGHGKAQAPNAHRRASEGGANIYYGLVAISVGIPRHRARL